jgi:hypothetical protein
MPVENILIAITINIVFDYKPSNGKFPIKMTKDYDQNVLVV